MALQASAQYIGNGDDAGRRVAPRVLYIPEQGGYVMGHGSYPEWDYGFSTSDDLRTWSQISGADPILSDISPHTELIRQDDTLYLFEGTAGDFGYYTLSVDDLTTISSKTVISEINQSSGASGSLVRCRDGWLWLGTDAWGPIRAYETTFEDFPQGWSERPESPSPVGIDTGASWEAGGYRNLTMLEVGSVLMLIVPATDSSGNTGQSQTAFYRANVSSEHAYVRRQFPYPIGRADEYTTSSTGYETIGWIKLPLDRKAAEHVYFYGRLDIQNSGAATTTVQLYDAVAGTALIEDTNGSYNYLNEGPFYISNNNYATNLLELRIKVSDGGTTGTLRGYQGQLDIVHRLGRQVY